LKLLTNSLNLREEVRSVDLLKKRLQSIYSMWWILLRWTTSQALKSA